MYSLNVALIATVYFGAAFAQTTVTVNTATTFQVIDGFGFSEAFGFGEAVQSAPAAQQTQALNLMFSTTEGAGMTILRNRIAADPGDTIEPNAPSSPSAAPTYVWNDNDESQVFWATAARAMGVEYIYADAWSAPGFMKTNDLYEDGGSLCGVTGETCASGDWRQAYANYLVEYINLYKQAGITIDFVGFLNEPEFAAPYDAMISDGTQAASFIPILFDTIQAAGLKTGIACCDAEGWNDQVTWTAQMIAANAEQFLSRVTSHWYTSQGTSPIDTTLRVWETEYADLDDAFSTTWFSSGAFNEGFTWAKFLHQGLVEANLSAFLYWVGAQADSNAAGLVTLTGSGSSTVVEASASLWAFAMFSRYIRPNAVRIATSGAPTNTVVSAYQNTDGTIAVVMLNEGSTTEAVTIAGLSVTSVSAFHMDNTVTMPASLTATISGGDVEATLPAFSAVTFVLTVGKTVTSPTSTTPVAPTTLKTSTTSPATPTSSLVPEFGQCGGFAGIFTGSTTCAPPFVCVFQNPFYSQCLSA